MDYNLKEIFLFILFVCWLLLTKLHPTLLSIMLAVVAGCLLYTSITDFSNMQERRPFLTWFTLGRYSHFPGREGDSPSNQQTVEVIARVPGTPSESLITR